jgi:hypothetical protein
MVVPGPGLTGNDVSNKQTSTGLKCMSKLSLMTLDETAKEKTARTGGWRVFERRCVR